MCKIRVYASNIVIRKLSIRQHAMLTMCLLKSYVLTGSECLCGRETEREQEGPVLAGTLEWIWRMGFYMQNSHNTGPWLADSTSFCDSNDANLPDWRDLNIHFGKRSKQNQVQFCVCVGLTATNPVSEKKRINVWMFSNLSCVSSYIWISKPNMAPILGNTSVKKINKAENVAHSVYIQQLCHFYSVKHLKNHKWITELVHLKREGYEPITVLLPPQPEQFATITLWEWRQLLCACNTSQCYTDCDYGVSVQQYCLCQLSVRVWLYDLVKQSWPHKSKHTQTLTKTACCSRTDTLSHTHAHCIWPRGQGAVTLRFV